MAAAMTVNLIVAVPATLRHRSAGAIRGDLVRVLTPSTAVALAAGVVGSNFLPGWQLRLMLAGFLAVYCSLTIWAVIRRRPEHPPESERVTSPRLVASAVFTGATAGLLGLGGGILQVPLLQALCRVPLRQAIGTSSAVMCLTAAIGAAVKLWSLPGLVDGSPVTKALLLAALMAPTAILAARVGAAATHRLPLPAVRAAIAVILLAAAARLAWKGGESAGWW
jgi:hypothetical protein